MYFDNDLSNLQYLKMRTSSWPYISVWANFRNYALCCSTDVHFLFVHRLQVAKEEICIVWLYIGKIDKNKVFAAKKLAIGAELLSQLELLDNTAERGGVKTKLLFLWTFLSWIWGNGGKIQTMLWNDFHHHFVKWLSSRMAQQGKLISTCGS